MGAFVLYNADIRTMDPAAPTAASLLVRDGRIAAAGTDATVRDAAEDGYETVDCRGAVIVPAFVDAHIHLLSYAASLSSVDCSPATVVDIPTLLGAIADRAGRTPPGAWIRAVGYRETELRERRHPTRWELDAAAPNNPVRVIHGSGHGTVLNSAALAAVGITNETEEPAGAMIGRRCEDGEIDGLLLELNELLDARIPRAPWHELRDGVAEACRRLVAAGVTAVHDMGVHNDAETFATFAHLRNEGALTVDVLPALGIEAFQQGERPPGWSGMVKVVINELDGRPKPDAEALASLIGTVDAERARVCIHAVSARACVTAAEALERSRRAGRPARPLHRVEHAAICPPDVARRLAALHAVVVANPGLLYADGDRYLREIAPEAIPYLHNPAALANAGIVVACGSDAPVSEPKPMRSIVASVTRTSRSGQRLAGPALPIEAALLAHTRTAAAAGGHENARGIIRPGHIADLILLPPDLLHDPTYDLEPIAVMQYGTWVVSPP